MSAAAAKRFREGVGIGLLAVATLAIIAAYFWCSFAIGFWIVQSVGLHPAIGALLGMFILCGGIGGLVGLTSSDVKVAD